MDNTIDVPSSVAWSDRFSAIASSAVVVTLACAVYWANPRNKRTLDALYGWPAFSFTGLEFLRSAALAYVAALAIYYLTARQAGQSKSRRFLAIVVACIRSPLALIRRGLTPQDRLAVLATLLKAFFGPLMVMSLMVVGMGAIASASGWISDASPSDFVTVFDRYGFWLLMRTILFVDVLIFTVGYLVELPRLRNEIRSVDPTLIGWAAALLCYPPFNAFTGAILGAQVSDFPQFDSPTTHLTLNGLMILLMAIYAWASVALGFKASNLTHRGIVDRGPYAYLRHPAYTCKNMAWWIASIPLASEAFARSFGDGIQSVASVLAWTLLYALRAVTEEDHLRSVDEEYDRYAKRVRYRFLPGIL